MMKSMGGMAGMGGLGGGGGKKKGKKWNLIHNSIQSILIYFNLMIFLCD